MVVQKSAGRIRLFFEFFYFACRVNVTDRIGDQTPLLLTIFWLMNSNLKKGEKLLTEYVYRCMVNKCSTLANFILWGKIVLT